MNIILLNGQNVLKQALRYQLRGLRVDYFGEQPKQPEVNDPWMERAREKKIREGKMDKGNKPQNQYPVEDTDQEQSQQEKDKKINKMSWIYGNRNYSILLFAQNQSWTEAAQQKAKETFEKAKEFGSRILGKTGDKLKQTQENIEKEQKQKEQKNQK